MNECFPISFRPLRVFSSQGPKQNKSLREVWKKTFPESNSWNFFLNLPHNKKLSRGVIGNTSDFGSEEFRFET